MNEAKNILLEWALFYAKQGLSIIPIKGKLPLIKWSRYQDEKANEEQIKEWWTKWPDADIGMVTGRISNRLILDIDGDEGRRAISSRTIESTQSVRTRRGTQYHFKFPLSTAAKTTIAGLLPEVDVRGEGGIVVLPPSKCSDGSYYAWIKDMSSPLADAPQWLLELLNKPASKESLQVESKEPWLEEILEGVGDGERHAALVRLAGYYFNSFPPDVAVIHLRSWNEKNSPPIEKLEFEEQVNDLKQRFVNGEYESTFKEPRKLELLSSVSLVKNYSKPPKYLVPGLIPMNTRTIFSGWQGRGKSFATTDLVIEVSRKKGQGKWLGEFETAQGPVIYIDNENAKNLAAHRLELLLKPKGLTTNDLNLHWVIGNHWKMTNQFDYSWLKEQVEEIKPVLIIVDSLASVHALDENTSKDMRYFFDDLVAPFCEEFNCGFLCIDHERKSNEGNEESGGKRLRGSGAKGDAVDTILALNEQNGITFVECAKSRYSKRHLPFVISIDNCSEGIVVRYGGELSR